MAYGGGYSESHDKKKKMAIIGVSSVLLVAMVAAVAVGVSKGGKGESGGGGGITTSQRNVKAMCQPTDYKESCEKALSSTNTTDPKELVKAAFHATIDELERAISNSSLIQEASKDPRTSKALDVCKEVMGDAIDDLQDSFNKMASFDLMKIDDILEDLRVWLSGAVSHQQACLDAFANTTGDTGEKMQKLLNMSRELTSNALAIVTEFSSIIGNMGSSSTSTRRLLSMTKEGFPTWMNDEKRRLLAASPAEIKADVIVAQDGSGKCKTLTEALKLIPKNNAKTFVIHVKAGIYKETVIFDKTMTHVLLMGDGPDKTKITYNNNFADGTPTWKTATVAAIGLGFMARDIGIENSAGAIKHQAVALRVQSDMSVIYNCRLEGFQDTLYTHAHRQFYRDCYISGTIDFIFGDAPAVIQNCEIVVRKPEENQQCMVTAQGRVDRREATAIVLQNCTIKADPAYLPVKDINKAFLGRPWKPFARTIVMESFIDGFIQPEGWTPWAGNVNTANSFLTEMNNRGPGANTNARATWKGVKKITPQHAADFTAGRFLGGDKWIPQTGVPYTSGMTNAH